MHRQHLLATLAAMSFGVLFSGCLEDRNVSPSVTPSPEQTGSARIVLPPIDVSALPKSGAQSKPLAWFVLSISNSSKDSSFSFPLSAKDTNVFLIPSIPIGWHYFHGEILNSAKKRTHVGDAYAVIAGNTVNPVSMKLYYAYGSVSVCVAIEGQPTPPCYRDSIPDTTIIDSLPYSRFPNPAVFDSSVVKTCWQFFPNVVDSLSMSHDPCYPDSGYLKMSTTNGTVSGHVYAFEGPGFDIMGSYDRSALRFDAIQKAKGNLPADTLRFNGYWGPTPDDYARGTTVQWPNGRRGRGFLYQVDCDSPVHLPAPPANCRE